MAVNETGRLWYGWAMLGVSSVALVATAPGQTFIVSMFNLEIREAFGLSASALAGAYMLATLGSASLMTLVGKGSDRFGPGRLMAVSAVGLWLATIWMANISGLASLALGFFGLRFFGQGALSLSSGHALAMWFERRLGVAEGVRLTVFGLCMLSLPAAVTWSIATVGWRWTWPVLGTVSAGLVLLLVALVHHDRPETIGSTLDGLPAEPGVSVEEVEGTTLSEALLHPAFWALTGASANSAMVVTALMFQLQPLALGKGLSASSAPGLIAAYATLSTSLYFVCGWLGDRVHPAIMVGGSQALLALGGLSFTAITPGWAPYLGMAGMGLASAMLRTSVTPTLARVFGRAHHGAIRGVVTTIGVAGTAVGPFLLGMSSDWTSAFESGLWLFVMGGVVAAIGAAMTLRQSS